MITKAALISFEIYSKHSRTMMKDIEVRLGGELFL
jgi:hypothetical protein